MQHPGLIYDLIKGVLRRAEVADRVNMTECLLRLEASNNSTGEELLFLFTLFYRPVSQSS